MRANPTAAAAAFARSSTGGFSQDVFFVAASM
jgi:hypothetical protein